MTGYVSRADGTQFLLPTPLEWAFTYTTGYPCDSFQMTCVWDGVDESPVLWREFLAYEDGALIFRGLIDEVETSLSKSGQLLELSGRGMAALLLDNEAVGQDYETATLTDILQDHVTCFGVEVGDCASFDPVSNFSVTTGSSAWSVLYEFCCYYGGISPRFGVDGKLNLTDWSVGDMASVVEIGDSAPVTELRCVDKRYGVISQILLRNKTTQSVMTMENSDFYEMGGRCRQVMNLPTDSSYQSARYSGQYQLDVSAGDLFRLELTMATGFVAWPGQLVQLQRSDWGRNGTYRVLEAEVSLGKSGYVTRLELGDVDITL